MVSQILDKNVIIQNVPCIIPEHKSYHTALFLGYICENWLLFSNVYTH